MLVSSDVFDMTRIWGTILLAFLGNLVSMVACAQGTRSEIGAVYSPKEVGLSYTYAAPDGNPWQMFRLVADLSDVVRGESATPGVRLVYNMGYPVRSWRSFGGTFLDLVAGPGAVIGLVKDHGTDHFSAVAGLSGMIGLYHHFTSRFVLGIGFNAELGICMSGKNTQNTEISYWTNGVRQAIMPELSISYRF